jgi:tetratricopeptide (TPR) repeat protein
MNDQRYSRLSEIVQKKWLIGCPIEIDKGALLIDQLTKQIILQLRLRNVSDLPIMQTDLIVYRYDLSGDAVMANETFISVSLTDMNVNPRLTFGDTTPILLGANNTRQVKIAFKKVVFADFSVWRNDEENYGDAIELIALTDALEPALAEQYIRDYESKYPDNSIRDPKFWPQLFNDRWICTCGFPNGIGRHACGRCGVSKEWLVRAVDIDNLHKNLSSYNEKISKEEKQKQIQAQNKKRVQKRIISALLILVIALSLGLLIRQYAVPFFRYRIAINALEDKNFDKATEIFTRLGDFKDSRTYVLQTKYEEGLDEIQARNYPHAIDIFSELEKYSDSEAKLLEAYYLHAADLVADGDLDEALKIYQSLKGYSDSENQIKLIHSMLGDIELKQGNILVAIDYYQQAGTTDKLMQAYNSAGEKALEVNDWTSAEYYFDMSNNTDMLNETKYLQAKNLVNTDQVRNGYLLLLELKDYKDAKQLAAQYREEATAWRIEAKVFEIIYSGQRHGVKINYTAYGGEPGETLVLREYRYSTISDTGARSTTIRISDSESGSIYWAIDPWGEKEKGYVELINDTTGETLARYDI